MGTKNTTTTGDVFNQGALNTYNSLQGPATGQLSSNMSNPQGNQLSTSLFNTGAATAKQLGAESFLDANANSAALRSGPSSSTTAAGTRAGAAMSGSTWNALSVGAQQRAQTSTAAAMQYRPLQTGGTNVQSTSGTGTWLTPLIGAGLSVGGALLGMPGAGNALSPGQAAGANNTQAVTSFSGASGNAPAFDVGSGNADNGGIGAWFNDDDSDGYSAGQSFSTGNFTGF
jgi:hypothetical protein